MEDKGLAFADRFAIFEQINLHQYAIDGDASPESAMEYVDLYWPEATLVEGQDSEHCRVWCPAYCPGAVTVEVGRGGFCVGRPVAAGNASLVS